MARAAGRGGGTRGAGHELNCSLFRSRGPADGGEVGVALIHRGSSLIYSWEGRRCVVLSPVGAALTWLCCVGTRRRLCDGVWGGGAADTGLASIIYMGHQ